MTPEEMILADAIKTAIETEKENIILRRIIGTLVLMLLLMLILFLRRCNHGQVIS